MKENYLDSRSPYIKNNIHGIEKTRKSILSLSNNEERETSDTLLRQKITNISKKIVGEEIKKFAEIASREISEEFSNLENRVTEVVQNSLEKTLNQKIKENVVILGHDIGKELDIKIQELNSLISHMETKLENLEYFSKSLEEKVEESLNKNIEENISEEPVFKIETKKKDSEIADAKVKIKEEDVVEKDTEEEVVKEIVNEIIEDNTDKKISKSKGGKEEDILDKEEYKDEHDYLNKNMKSVLSKFEKNGFLFRKNTFTSSLKDLNVKDFLNNSEDYTNIDTEDKDKLEEILEDIVRETKSEPKEKETIEEFLKRAYLKKYNDKK